MTTGEKIRQIRLLKKFSQENMASMLGISRLAYSDIERGKTNVSDSRLQEIAEKLEVTKSHIESFGERIAIFFDKCEVSGVNNGKGYNIIITTNE